MVCIKQINNEFIRHEFSEVEFINREEDMGLPGLRQAKESYNPDHLLKNMTQYMLMKQIMRQAVNKNLSYEVDVLHSSFCYNRSVSLSI